MRGWIGKNGRGDGKSRYFFLFLNKKSPVPEGSGTGKRSDNLLNVDGVNVGLHGLTSGLGTGGIEAYLKNEIAQHDTGITISWDKDDTKTIQFKDKTYKKLVEHLETVDIIFDENIGADQTVANLSVPITEPIRFVAHIKQLTTAGEIRRS